MKSALHPMKLLRGLAIAAFVGGAGLLVVGFIRSDGKQPTAEADTFVAITVVATEVPSATVTPTGTSAATPTATPEPFNGSLARFKIPKFKVDSAVETIGLIPNTNQLDTPHDPLNTGWYDLYSKPGFVGNALFSAHVDYWPNIIGPFKKLSELERDDEVIIVMENGLEYRYRVIFKERYDVSTMPMGELIDANGKARPGANGAVAPARPADAEWVTLITCGGRFNKTDPRGFGEYLDRDVVIAERIVQ
jgi:Sortase domain